MDWCDLSLDNPADNLALDEALLLGAEQGTNREVLRIWQSDVACVVLGASCALAEDVNESACVADGVPILRRSSGGGTVLIGPGCLLYSLVFSFDRAPELRQIGPSYCYILEQVARALAVPRLRPAGISDLALGLKKVSGNAQQRKRNFLLHHGTLLYAFDSRKAGRYLRMPVRQPEYRRQRPDTEFLTNLPLSRDEITARLRLAFGPDQDLQNWHKDMTRQLVVTKYASPDWTRRR